MAASTAERARRMKQVQGAIRGLDDTRRELAMLEAELAKERAARDAAAEIVRDAEERISILRALRQPPAVPQIGARPVVQRPVPTLALRPAPRVAGVDAGRLRELSHMQQPAPISARSTVLPLRTARSSSHRVSAAYLHSAGSHSSDSDGKGLHRAGSQGSLGGGEARRVSSSGSLTTKPPKAAS